MALAISQELPHLHGTVQLIVPTRDARSCGCRVSIRSLVAGALRRGDPLHEQNGETVVDEEGQQADQLDLAAHRTEQLRRDSE